jgi:hypothetical protein
MDLIESIEPHSNLFKDEGFLSWDVVPSTAKEKIREHVRKEIVNQNVETATEVFVRGFRAILEKEKKTVSLKWAVLDVLKEMGVKRKFSLRTDGEYWIVSFIYDLTSC